jgi:hypothetical protein
MGGGGGEVAEIAFDDDFTVFEEQEGVGVGGFEVVVEGFARFRSVSRLLRGSGFPTPAWWWRGSRGLGRGG